MHNQSVYKQGISKKKNEHNFFLWGYMSEFMDSELTLAHIEKILHNSRYVELLANQTLNAMQVLQFINKDVWKFKLKNLENKNNKQTNKQRETIHIKDFKF